LHVVFGLAIAAIGLVAAGLMLFIGIFSFQADHSPVERFGSALICALIAAAIIAGAFFAFRGDLKKGATTYVKNRRPLSGGSRPLSRRSSAAAFEQ
jgi:hypothetical protein